MRCYGFLTALVCDARTDRVLARSVQPNIITDDGLDHMRGILGCNVDFMTDMAVGTGSTAPSATDSSLDTEVFRNEIARRVPTAANLRMQMFLGTGDANGFTLSEAGIFNAATGGDMFSRVLIVPAIVKTVAITVTLTWDFAFMEG